MPKKPKLTEQEKAMLRKKLLHGGEYPMWTNTRIAPVAFTRKQQQILWSAESKTDPLLKNHNNKKAIKKHWFSRKKK